MQILQLTWSCLRQLHTGPHLCVFSYWAFFYAVGAEALASPLLHLPDSHIEALVAHRCQAQGHAAG